MVLLQPGVRDARVLDGRLHIGPGIHRTDVEKARLGILAVGLIQIVARTIGRAPVVPDRALDAVVLLPAFAAEHQRQENPRTIAWHVLLALDCDVPLRLRLERGIDRVAPADELMQAEGKDGLVGIRVAALRSDEQGMLDRLAATGFRLAGQFGEHPRGAALSPDCQRRGADEPAALGIGLNAEGALDPGRQWIAQECLVVGREVLVVGHSFAQFGNVRRV